MAPLVGSLELDSICAHEKRTHNPLIIAIKHLYHVILLYCDITSRNLLGSKILFTTSCENYISAVLSSDWLLALSWLVALLVSAFAAPFWTAVRHALLSYAISSLCLLFDIGGVEVSLCAIHVA